MSSTIELGGGKSAAASITPSFLCFSTIAPAESVLFSSVAVFINPWLSFLESSSIFTGFSGYGGK